jgi:hypothetical protein
VGSYNSICTIKEGTKLCEVVTLQFDRRRANGSRVGRECVASGSEWVTNGSREWVPNGSPVGHEWVANGSPVGREWVTSGSNGSPVSRVGQSRVGPPATATTAKQADSRHKPPESRSQQMRLGKITSAPIGFLETPNVICTDYFTENIFERKRWLLY